MSSSQDACPKCGADLAAQAAGGRCPACLLQAAIGDAVDSSAATVMSAAPGGTVGLIPAASAPREAAGSMIGRYKLLEEIGEGGFGIVYLAHQTEPVKRKVALKILKPGMDTREVVARFEAERQALALMDHPNIARVFDGGATESGRPYFVMELVKGLPLTQYCDDNRLGTNQRLELFLDVLAAVQHAHQKGIIHRDLKPSNILVSPHDGKPVIKVIDFGIAKAISMELTEKTLFTGHGRLVGTPQYMSPEQTELNALDVDTRSDLYSLGVVLYELLTGRTPIDAKKLREAGYDEVQRLIREEEPPKPSTRISTLGEALTSVAQQRGTEPVKLGKQMRGDLDWIVMKALEKERVRRYETANGFATDIRRHLNNEPVEAGAPSAFYRLRKLVRRNKLAIAAGGAVLLALFSGAGLSIWQAVVATRARDLAGLAEQRALGEKARAEEQAQVAMRAEKRAFDSLAQVAAERDAKEFARKDAEDISKFLSEVFRSPDPARDGRTITVAETLDTAAKKLETSLATQPAQRARLLATLGSTYSALGLAHQAIPLQEKVRDYHLVTSGPEHVATLSATNNLALSYFHAGRLEDAVEMQDKVLALRRQLNGPEHPDTLSAMNNLALSYFGAGRRDDALKLREEVLALRRKVLGPEHPDTLMAMNNLSHSYFGAGRRKDAIKMREEVVLLRRKVNGPEHPDTLTAMNSLALSYSAAGRLEDAIKMQDEVLALRRKVNGPEHPDTLSAMNNLANSLFDAGRQDEALKLQEKVLQLRCKVNGPEHPDTLRAMNNLAVSYLETGRRDEALKLREEVLQQRSRLLGPEHPDTLSAMHNLAISYFEIGHRDKALRLREEVLALQRRVLGPEHPDTLAAMSDLADSYAAAGRRDEALKLREEVLALRRKVLGPEHPDTLTAMTRLASSCSAAGRRDEALKLREEVLPLRRKVSGPEDPDTLGAMTNLAISYGDAGRLPEAVALQEQSLAIKRRALPPSHPYLAVALNHLAKLYEKSGRNDEAAELRAELATLRAKK